MKPSTFKGREHRLVPLESPGKRHFWGYRGKNYGFYTTNQELDMQERSKIHRQHSYHDARYQLEERHRSIDVHRSFDRVQTEPSEGPKGSMGASLPIQNIELSDWNARQNQSDSLRKQLQMRKAKDLKLMSKNLDIRLFPDNIQVKLPALLPTPKHETEADAPLARQSKDHPHERVVYFQRRNRALNPTFCNSAAYPLPCYRRAL